MTEMRTAKDLLLGLAAGDEHSLRAIFRPAVEPAGGDLPDGEPASGEQTVAGSALDRRTRLLVRLGALLALDAPTDSLRLAVDLASTAGAGDEAVAGVLLATGSAAGSAQLVSSAARLAVVLEYETDVPAPGY